MHSTNQIAFLGKAVKLRFCGTYRWVHFAYYFLKHLNVLLIKTFLHLLQFKTNLISWVLIGGEKGRGRGGGGVQASVQLTGGRESYTSTGSSPPGPRRFCLSSSSYSFMAFSMRILALPRTRSLNDSSSSLKASWYC